MHFSRDLTIFRIFVSQIFVNPFKKKNFFLKFSLWRASVNNNNNSHQVTLPTFQRKITERQKINHELVKAFALADIPLEKIEKLKPFLKDNCQNGICFF